MKTSLKFIRGVSPEHIGKLNICESFESLSSGSLNNLADGVPILDGFHVKSGENLVGWAVIFGAEDRTEGHFMVHPEHRRQGIGRELYRLMREVRENFNVCRWSYGSREFYNTLGAGQKGYRWS